MGLTRVIAKSDGDNKGGMGEKGGREGSGQSVTECENQGREEAVSRKIDGAKSDEDGRGGASVRGKRRKEIKIFVHRVLLCCDDC